MPVFVRASSSGLIKIYLFYVHRPLGPSVFIPGEVDEWQWGTQVTHLLVLPPETVIKLAGKSHRQGKLGLITVYILSLVHSSL